MLWMVQVLYKVITILDAIKKRGNGWWLILELEFSSNCSCCS